jgi:hypothetical protein
VANGPGKEEAAAVAVAVATQEYHPMVAATPLGSLPAVGEERLRVNCLSSRSQGFNAENASGLAFQRRIVIKVRNLYVVGGGTAIGIYS